MIFEDVQDVPNHVTITAQADFSQTIGFGVHARPKQIRARIEKEFAKGDEVFFVLWVFEGVGQEMQGDFAAWFAVGMDVGTALLVRFEVLERGLLGWWAFSLRLWCHCDVVVVEKGGRILDWRRRIVRAATRVEGLMSTSIAG